MRSVDFNPIHSVFGSDFFFFLKFIPQISSDVLSFIGRDYENDVLSFIGRDYDKNNYM